MATNKKVIVLVPNGRRQNVEVTPNTTILQILEEVCQKYEYNTDDYDLKHFNNVLDPNTMLRFTGLANNAQLEMIPCKKIRSTAPVVISVQLENGKRITGEFNSNATLIEVMKDLNFKEDLDKVTLVYMHCEISGLEKLKNTTLKSLGLNNGRAIFRVIYKNNEHINESKTSNFNENLGHVICNETELDNSKEQKPSKTIKEKKEMEDKQDAPSSSRYSHEIDKIIAECNKQEKSDPYDIDFVSNRNTIIFNQVTIQGTSRDEFPDDFYDLTIHDAKILLRDAKHNIEKLEEAPLLTTVQRQQLQIQETSAQLDKYLCTIIRVYFPDQFVLQGLFKPTETVQSVKDFIKEHLIDTNGDFMIFTSPPKHVLNPSARLIDENLVPSAIVYYSGSSALNSETKENVVDQGTVKMQMDKVRMLMTKQQHQMSHENEKTNDAKSSEVPVNTHSENKSLNKKSNKVPKWFKMHT